jgi:hypothetical protein
MAGIFSRFIFNNAIFNTDGDSPNIPDGGTAGFDYTNYRKHLEELSRIERERQVRKYKSKVKKVIKLAKKAPPEIKAVIEQIEPSIDLTAWNLNIEAKIAELIKLVDFLQEQERIEEENKIAILLLLA